MAKQNVELIVNGDHYFLAVDPWRTLAEVLREDINLTGTKIGCGQGDCGACTVLMDGNSISSCLTLAVECHQREIMTIEGLAPNPRDLHPLQESFIENGAIQCGYCTAGMILAAKHLLDKKPTPSEREIREGLSGNLCRCTGYTKIVKAIEVAGQKMAATKEG